jgi:hypothetical protein
MDGIASAVLDGAFCQGCGEYLGDGYGVPRWCGGCGGPAADGGEPRRRRRGKKAKRTAKEGAAAVPKLTPEAKAAGFRVCGNPFHWQANSPRGLVNYWPTRKRWMVGRFGKTKTGTFTQMLKDAKLPAAPR